MLADLYAREALHHSSTRIVFGDDGKVAGIRHQGDEISKLLSEANSFLEVELFMNGAYSFRDSDSLIPAATSLDKAVIKTGCQPIKERLETDPAFKRLLSEFVGAHLIIAISANNLKGQRA